jgi:hypothetical protein
MEYDSSVQQFVMINNEKSLYSQGLLSVIVKYSYGTYHTVLNIPKYREPEPIIDNIYNLASKKNYNEAY